MTDLRDFIFGKFAVLILGHGRRQRVLWFSPVGRMWDAAFLFAEVDRRVVLNHHASKPDVEATVDRVVVVAGSARGVVIKA